MNFHLNARARSWSGLCYMILTALYGHDCLISTAEGGFGTSRPGGGSWPGMPVPKAPNDCVKQLTAGSRCIVTSLNIPEYLLEDSILVTFTQASGIQVD